jgi:hypothetical protein
MTEAVAATFVHAYFPTVLKKEPNAFQTFYGTESKLTVGDNQPITGSAAVIDRHIQRLRDLGEFKIDLKHVDAVSGTGGQVIVAVVGSYVTRTAEHHFVHGFVLQPTARRDNTYFVLSEWIRETNVVPDRSVTSRRREDEPQAQAAPQPAKRDAPPQAAPEREVERKIRKRACVLIVGIPKRCTTGDIQVAAGAIGHVLSCKRAGKFDAAVEFQSLRAAEKLVASAKEFQINGGNVTDIKMITAEEFDAAK